MSDIDIIRAWKDEDYFNSLSEEMRSQLLENPAGIIELADTEMARVAGGLSEPNSLCVDACPSTSLVCITIPCNTGPRFDDRAYFL